MLKRRILVFGAGAIGTYLGASLALQGHQVLLLEREADLPALSKQGLMMTLGEEHYRIRDAQFASSLAVLEQTRFDLAVLALKTYHLEAALPDLIKWQLLLPPLLCLQNGVDSEPALIDALGPNAVIPGTVTSAVDRLDKGRIILQKKRGMGIAGDHPALQDFQVIFNQAGLNCRLYSRADAMKWSKLISNLLGNASSAILNLSPGAIYAHPGLYQMELDQIRECLQVMKSLRVPAVNLPGVPVRLLAGVIRSTPPALSQRLLARLIGRGRGEKMPSFHIDLYSGRGKSEVGQLNGAIVRAGKIAGVDTPVNEFLTSKLTALTAGQLPLTHYQGQPGLFLQDLRAYQENRSLNG